MSVSLLFTSRDHVWSADDHDNFTNNWKVLIGRKSVTNKNGFEKMMKLRIRVNTRVCRQRRIFFDGNIVLIGRDRCILFNLRELTIAWSVHDGMNFVYTCATGSVHLAQVYPTSGWQMVWQTTSSWYRTEEKGIGLARYFLPLILKTAGKKSVDLQFVKLRLDSENESPNSVSRIWHMSEVD